MATMARFYHVIFFPFVISFFVIPLYYGYVHTDYEEIAIYPQKEHSLIKPYQGKTIFSSVLSKSNINKYFRFWHDHSQLGFYRQYNGHY